MTAVEASTNSLLCFNFTTHDPSKDQSCIIRPGEHPFVQHDTVVAYGMGRLWPASFVRQTDMLVEKDPVESGLLERIRFGALESPFTRDKYKKIVRHCLGLDGGNGSARSA